MVGDGEEGVKLVSVEIRGRPRHGESLIVIPMSWTAIGRP